MKRLRLTPEAELDVDEAHLWYHRQTPGLAATFLAAVNACIASIQRHPEACALVDPITRRALVRRFPYAIFCEVGATEIVVFAIFHAARDPRAWKRRRDG